MQAVLKKVLIMPVLAAALSATACTDDPLAQTREAKPPVDTVVGDAGVQRLHELLAVINSGDALP